MTPEQLASAGSPQLSVQSDNPAEAKALFIGRFRDFAQDEHWDIRISNEIELILEEWLTNLVCYGLPGIPGPTVSFELWAKNSEALIRLTDNGQPFDPVSFPEPDVTKPLQERPIGGMGILIIKRLSDEMKHERSGALNVVEIRKSLAKPVLGRG